ncbi:MAG: flavodoxin family protein [Clostridia bacterium]|nr:flavodoxin family protein [Clostridia bacterium]
MKNILIINTSPRKGGNTEALAESFAAGAKEAGNNVEIVSLRDKTIAFCRGCFACQKLGKCVIKDDANEITDKICNADVVVWATPIYYYSMSGQMKTMIDRANSLYSRDYKFREVYLLSVAADNDPKTDEGAAKGVQGWVDCFDGVTFVDRLFVGGVNDPGDIKEKEGLTKAFALGKTIK